MPEQSPTLRDMIQEAANSGHTYEQLAQRAKRRGAKTSGSYLNNIVLGNVSRLPTPENLRGIAWALDVPYERVRQAAINQWLPPDDNSAPEIPEVTKTQLIDEIQRLRDLADRVLAEAEGQGGAPAA